MQKWEYLVIHYNDFEEVVQVNDEFSEKGPPKGFLSGPEIYKIVEYLSVIEKKGGKLLLFLTFVKLFLQNVQLPNSLVTLPLALHTPPPLVSLHLRPCNVLAR